MLIEGRVGVSVPFAFRTAVGSMHDFDLARSMSGVPTATLLDSEELRTSHSLVTLPAWVGVRALTAAAKKISRSLRDIVRVEITDGDDRSSLTKVINQLSGRTDKIRSAIESAAMVSVRELAGVCRARAQRIMELYPGVTQGQADALAVNAG